MDQHAVVGRHLWELLKGAEKKEACEPGPVCKNEFVFIVHLKLTHLLLVMKSIMSCSSFSSVMRSLGLLLRVSTINWCRSMPVESVYSRLDSGNHNQNNLVQYTQLPIKLHPNTPVSILLHFRLPFIYKTLILHTHKHAHTPLESGCFFGSALPSPSSSLHEVLSLTLQLEETSGPGAA